MGIPIVVVVATSWEIGCVSRNVDELVNVAAPGLQLKQGKINGKRVLLARTGIGVKNAQAAANYLIKKYDPDCLISFGVAGGLKSERRSGDVIVCKRVRCADTKDENSDCVLDEALVDRAYASLKGMNGFKGIEVTVGDVAAEAGDKELIAKKFGCDVCEMEDYWIARIAYASKTPFFSVRVVYDEQKFTLPRIDSMVNNDGYMKMGTVIGKFATTPMLALKTFGLYRRYRIAAKNLTIAAKRILNALVGDSP